LLHGDNASLEFAVLYLFQLALLLVAGFFEVTDAAASGLKLTFEVAVAVDQFSNAIGDAVRRGEVGAGKEDSA